MDSSDQARRGGPLSGVTVIELGGIGPVPFAGMLLLQLGAEVLRIDRPTSSFSVIPPDGDQIHAGKDSVRLDLKSAADIERLHGLLDRADAMIEGHRPGVLERLGIGPATLLGRHERLVIGRMTGWGQEGPLARTAGHDLNFIAVTGALDAIGAADGPPQIPLNLVGDYGGGALYLVVGVLAALQETARGGKGQVVDAAIVDGVAHLMSGVHAALAVGLWKEGRGTNLLDGGDPAYAVYETADGRHISVTAVEESFFNKFVCLLGIDATPEDRHDVGRRQKLRDQIAAAVRTRTRDEWSVIFDGSDACVAPVLGLNEAEHHPQLRARRTFSRVNGVLRAAPAPRFTRPDNLSEKP